MNRRLIPEERTIHSHSFENIKYVNARIYNHLRFHSVGNITGHIHRYRCRRAGEVKRWVSTRVVAWCMCLLQENCSARASVVISKWWLYLLLENCSARAAEVVQKWRQCLLQDNCKLFRNYVSAFFRRNVRLVSHELFFVNDAFVFCWRIVYLVPRKLFKNNVYDFSCRIIQL